MVIFFLKMGFRRLQHFLSVFSVLYTQYIKYSKTLGEILLLAFSSSDSDVVESCQSVYSILFDRLVCLNLV